MTTHPSIVDGPPSSPDLVSEPDVAPSPSPVFALAKWLAVRAIVAGAVVVGGGALLLVRPDLMLVEHVRFEGDARAREGELRHLVDVKNGTTMWTVDLARAAKGAEKHPWVRHAVARREWPDTVVVSVDEYVPVAMLAQPTGIWYVDADGTAFLRARSDDLDYPVITGLDGSLADAHPDLPHLVVRDALALLSSLDEQGLVHRGDVSEIAFSDTRGFTVHVRGGARVVFGLEQRDRELSRLSALIARGVDLSKPVLVDLVPDSLAIVRPLQPDGSDAPLERRPPPAAPPAVAPANVESPVPGHG